MDPLGLLSPEVLESIVVERGGIEEMQLSETSDRRFA